MVAWKPEVHFRKSVKSRVPYFKCPLQLKATDIFIDYFMFSWSPGLNMLLAWFLDVTLHRKYNMADE